MGFLENISLSAIPSLPQLCPIHQSNLDWVVDPELKFLEAFQFSETVSNCGGKCVAASEAGFRKGNEWIDSRAKCVSH